MSRRHVLPALLIVALLAPATRAQIPVTRDQIPTRSALERLGLERNWSGVVPLGAAYERVLLLSQADGMLFAQTSQANLHAFDAETGRYLWGVNLGRPNATAFPVSVNSDRVLVTNMQDLHCLDRGTGRGVWKVTLEALPSTATACDEERAIVGLSDGKLVAYTMRDHTKDVTPGKSAATFLWAWKTNGRLTGRPLPAERVVAFGSQDSRVYVALIDESTLIYRYLTGGPISASLSGLGTRTLLIPSEDNNLYAIDLFNGETRWVYASGAPLQQEPVVARGDVFTQNAQGVLASVDPQAGTPRWERFTGQSNLVAVSPTRVYLQSRNGDLVIVERATGRLLADAAATLDRAGLRLRDYTLAPTNRFNDRLYFGTPTGLLYSFREAGLLQPVPLRDPNEKPFGYIPDLDEESTPPDAPPADAAPGSEPATDFGAGFP